MSSVIIYTDEKNTLLKDFCERAADIDVYVKSTSEIKNMAEENASAAVIDMPLNRLKELSMVMKFPLPVLVICSETPENITIRGEAYDFIITPPSRYEITVRLRNLLKIKELKDKIGSIASIDELTGLYNRRYLLERLDAEMSRARRHGSNVSCILFDIDNFKVVNDMYGYEWGDVLLKKIAEMLSNLVRKEDTACRCGDEEFMVILPDTSEENAFIFAERFRRDVEKMSFVPAGEDERHPVKISGGIASFPYLESADENANALIRYAEHALYSAKKRGKNKVVLFSQVNLDF